MRKTFGRYFIWFVILSVLLVLSFFVALRSGSTDISYIDIAHVLLGYADDGSRQIIINIRLPRILGAIMLGGALSVSGFLLQIFFGNPIAGPYVLGISSSAKLFVALTMVFLLNRGASIGTAGMVAMSFLGSLAAMSVVLVLARRVRNMSLLVVCGVMIGYICQAITEFVVAFAQDSNIVNLHNWSLGSFSGFSYEYVQMSFAIVAVSVVLTVFLSKPIGAYQMGEAYAKNMGVDIKKLRVSLIILSSILSAAVTAFAGPISFVGIAVPHIIRGIFKTAKPLVMIPACFLGGGIITLICDVIARTVFAPTEMSISSVTSILLAPVVIYLLVTKRKSDV